MKLQIVYGELEINDDIAFKLSSKQRKLQLNKLKISVTITDLHMVGGMVMTRIHNRILFHKTGIWSLGYVVASS